MKYFVNHLDGKPIKIANGDNALEVIKILERATDSLFQKVDNYE